MPPMVYVRSMEMRRDVDTLIGVDGRVTRRTSPGCNVTITIEIAGWEGGRPNVLFLPIAGDTIPIAVTREAEAQPKRKRQRKEKPPLCSPCLPLPAPREPSRWDFLEVDND